MYQIMILCIQNWRRLVYNERGILHKASKKGRKKDDSNCDGEMEIDKHAE